MTTLVRTGGNVEYAGTPSYFAPEILQDKFYNEKVDIWGLGCVLYMLASLKHPFDYGNSTSLKRNILYRSPKQLPKFILY